MDIINRLEIQLSKIKSILIIELKQGEYIYDYYICEDKDKFLDTSTLKSYLTETPIYNTHSLNIINELCSDILSIWINDFQKLPMKTFKESVGYEGKYTSVNSLLDFHAFYVKNDDLKHYNTSQGKKNFVAKYHFSERSIKWISYRCNEIKNFIEDAFPERKPDNFDKSNKFKKYGWFEVGLLFASGEMKVLLAKHNRNATQIAKERFGDNWKKYRPYISESISKTNTNDKNIFSNNNKLLRIQKHCLANKIQMTQGFIDLIKPK